MPYLLCSSSVLAPGSSIVQEFSTIPQPFQADAIISLLTQTGIRSWQEKEVAHGHMAYVTKNLAGLGWGRAFVPGLAQTPVCGQGDTKAKAALKAGTEFAFMSAA